MKKITKRQIIKDYKNHFGIQDIPFKNLGKGDKEIIEWAEDLVKNLALYGVVKSLNDKPTQTFDEFVTGICKNRGITLINNYTKETVGLDTLIEKWKATNT